METTTQPAAITTRSQRYFTTALAHVTTVAAETAPGDPRRTTYGSLCHAFPIMVRKNGLCLAIAFVDAKGQGDGDGARKRAHRDLIDHVAAQLELPSGDLSGRVANAPVAEYLRLTRTILAAWVYYKRFAVSILKIEADQQPEGA